MAMFNKMTAIAPTLLNSSSKLRCLIGGGAGGRQMKNSGFVSSSKAIYPAM